MKKVSTAATKQTNNFGEQKLTIGLDPGDRSSWYCMLERLRKRLPLIFGCLQAIPSFFAS
jgi:hypothetical protein